MSTDKHTPGPWAYQASAGNHDWLVYSENPDGKDIAIVRQFHEANNAALIAAAPELLVAAAFADDEIGKHMAAIEAGEYSAQQIVEILCDIQNAARAAIAKTTGEST